MSSMEQAPHPIESRDQKKELREQFLKTEVYTYGPTTVEAFDIQPEKPKTEVPAFFCGGWGASRGVYEGAIVDMADRGRRVCTLFAPHGVEADPEMREVVPNYSAVELRKAAALLKVLEEKKLEQVDIVAQSEGAIWSVMLASIYPERVRNIVLIDPAGIMGEDNLKRLGVSFSKDIVRETLNSANHPRPEVERNFKPGSPDDLLGALKNIFGNPILSLKEVLAISSSDIRDMLVELRAQGKHVAVVHGADDVVFPMDKIAGTKEGPGALTTKEVDGFYSVYGEHNEMNANPEGYALVVDHALDALERLPKKEPNGAVSE